MSDKLADPKLTLAIRRNFLSYFGLKSWLGVEKYHANFTKRLETFGITASAKTSATEFQPSTIQFLELNNDNLTVQIDVKTGEEQARRHVVKIVIPVAGIELMIAAIEFDRASRKLWQKNKV